MRTPDWQGNALSNAGVWAEHDGAKIELLKFKPSNPPPQLPRAPMGVRPRGTAYWIVYISLTGPFTLHPPIWEFVLIGNVNEAKRNAAELFEWFLAYRQLEIGA